MFKSLLFTLPLALSLCAAESRACGSCVTGKSYMKCSYYVEKMGDLSRQKSCLEYADSLMEGESPGRASWYYLIGGDFDKAIAAGEKAVKRKETFALEQIAEAALLKGDKKGAKEAFERLRRKGLKDESFIRTHFEILKKLYPEKFDEQEAQSLLK